ncbi:MAG TPA: hypothetical protein EYO58_00235, partial [Flavobacteriales bacterium]|nr:hypothetical protein [Flavobacteriales bacterium]
MGVIRQFDSKEISVLQLHKRLLLYRDIIFDHKSRPVVGLEDTIEANIGPYRNELLQVTPRISEAPLSYEALLALTKVQTIDPVCVRKTRHDDNTILVNEVGLYTHCKDRFVQEFIDDMTSIGCEIRMVKSQYEKPCDVPLNIADSYFRVSQEGIPIIGINLAIAGSLTTLAHEVEHVRMWHECKIELASKDALLTKSQLANLANDFVMQPRQRVLSERRSIAAELKIETNDDSVFNRVRKPRARHIAESGYTARMLYPECEGIRDELHRCRWSEKSVDDVLVNELMANAVKEALRNRKKHFEYYMNKARTLCKASPTKRVEAAELRALAYAVRSHNVFECIFKYDIKRLNVIKIRYINGR